MKQYPKNHTVYRFEELCKLDLPDSPCLQFNMHNTMQTIQDSHVTVSDLLNDECWRDSLWHYDYTTREEIPVFSFSKNNVVKIEDLCDIEPWIDPFKINKNSMWVTPKGHPREQYCKIVSDHNGEHIECEDGMIYPLPVFAEDNRNVEIDPGYCDQCKTFANRRISWRDPEEGYCREYSLCESCLIKNRTE